MIGRAIGASIATGVWLYVSALAILLGGEVNGELMRRRAPAQSRAVYSSDFSSGSSAAFSPPGSSEASEVAPRMRGRARAMPTSARRSPSTWGETPVGSASASPRKACTKVRSPG